jgi:hypothetical protein
MEQQVETFQSLYQDGLLRVQQAKTIEYYDGAPRGLFANHEDRSAKDLSCFVRCFLECEKFGVGIFDALDVS